MNKRTVNILLVAGFFLPLILIFWPFAVWGDTMSLILRIIPSLSIQALFCNVFKDSIINAIPLAVTAGVAIWGIYLFFTSSSWIYATVGGLVADYISMFICCAGVYILYVIQPKS